MPIAVEEAEGAEEEAPAAEVQGEGDLETEEEAGGESPGEDLYASTMKEIEEVIRRLNTINRNKDYEEWLKWLDPEYAAKLGDADYLQEVSQTPRMLQEKIVLKSLRDYFINVFIAARQNVRVDEIEFISPAKVAVITVNARSRMAPEDPGLLAQMLSEGWTLDKGRVTKVSRERYYSLEKTGGMWKIVDE